MLSLFRNKYTVQLTHINREYELEIRENNEIIQLSLLYGTNIMYDFYYFLTKQNFTLIQTEDTITLELYGSKQYNNFIEKLKLFEKNYKILIF